MIRPEQPTGIFLKWGLCLSKGGFPGSSAGKESTCNAGDPSLIPGLGRSPAEGIGYWLQYSWVSLVAQIVKNPPAMRETWVWSLGWEDPLEEGMATHSSILAWRIPMVREAWRTTVRGVTNSQAWQSDWAHSTLPKTLGDRDPIFPDDYTLKE